jgi:hypothetical protein
MSIDWTAVVEVVEALAWPAVVLLALYLFKQPLIDLVGELARRARKVSVFEVSIELATLPQMQAPWSVGNVDPRRLSSSQIFDSATQTIFQELLKPAQAEYAIVDLRSGDAWLTSRLFIFAVVLGEVSRLRAFVFLESASGRRRRYVGVATSTDVRRALGRRYPWLEEALIKALRGEYPADTAEPPAMGASAFSNQQPPLSGLESWRVTSVVRRYVEYLQRMTSPPNDESESYLEIGTSPQTWERAHWIDAERLERDLGEMLEQAWVEDSPDKARAAVADAIARRNATYVATVDEDRRFVALVDRPALLAERAATSSTSRSAARTAPEPAEV